MLQSIDEDLHIICLLFQEMKHDSKFPCNFLTALEHYFPNPQHTFRKHVAAFTISRLSFF